MKDALVGKYFFYMDPETESHLVTRGQILERVDTYLWLVQMYDWKVSGRTEQRLVKMEELLPWSFFDDPDDATLDAEIEAKWPNSGLKEDK